jgi:hypothetical protein
LFDSPREGRSFTNSPDIYSPRENIQYVNFCEDGVYGFSECTPFSFDYVCYGASFDFEKLLKVDIVWVDFVAISGCIF